MLVREYWTEKDHLALDNARSFEELSEIALAILTRMQRPTEQVCTICGPMSTGGLGSLEANMARFSLAVNRAKYNGLLVFEQIPFQNAIVRLSLHKTRRGEYNHDILELFYRRVFESRHIHRTLFLPGWEDSVGAKWERNLVTSLGLIVSEYPVEWLNQA
jgi:hypothetical protein